MASRKRRAPGTSPPVQQYHDNALPTEYNWSDPAAAADVNASYNDPALYDQLNYNSNMQGHNRVVSLDGMENDMDVGSGQLVRRNPNQQLTARPGGPWESYNNGQQGAWEQVDDDEELEQKAMLAKKDAMAKRKQIPPFVQKLSSFLDNGNNTNLIRWSDDGNSFIVLDEDEFARTLIPELFKHKNYASFVRQLNMYGFHKKVGLSDNSMKASETKAKAPSEYYNKYFKRGRPELLWLIQKPKNPTAGPKRKREDDGAKGDSDEERKYVQDTGGGGLAEDLALRGGSNTDMAMIPRTEYNSLRNEVRQLQQQQKVISNVLGQIRRQNDSLYQQATSFQTLHERHENSINAILTFLATFYNRSLEGGNNAVNLADMFGAAMPQQQAHGNVVDMSEFSEKPVNKSPAMNRQKRPLLLPAPNAVQSDTRSPSVRAATMSPSASPLPQPKIGNRPSVFKPSAPRPTPGYPNQVGQDGNAPTQLKNDSTSPPQMNLPENDEILSAIQSMNANTNQPTNQAPQLDFSNALNQYQTQGGNSPLTPQQRNEVLSLMANNTSVASPNSTLAQNTNNAFVNPNPPPMPQVPEMEQTQAQLDFLQKMSEEQNTRVQNLSERLQPLSPSGQIPGLTDNGYFGNVDLGDPGTYDLDLNSFVQEDDFFPNPPTHNGGMNQGESSLSDLNYELPATGDLNNAGAGLNFGDKSAQAFDFDGANDRLNVNEPAASEGRVESVSSNATSPAATVEEVEDESRRRSPKKRKK